MKLFISRKKYDLLNKEYLLLNDNYEELKSIVEKNNKEELINFILPELKKEINLNKYKVK